MIPMFDKRGYLPEGKPYIVTWEEFETRFGNNDHRKRLLSGLKMALDNLKQAGCCKVYIDGSFITTKENPGDWDACWEIQGVDSKLLDPVIIDADFQPHKLTEKYFGDLFLQAPRLPGGNFVNYFQKDRDGKRKGIVVINLATLP